jgi:hypothetical protein
MGMTFKERYLHVYFTTRKRLRNLKARIGYRINKRYLENDLMCRKWRTYARAITYASEKNIFVADEILTAAILDIPEHYKITGLCYYTNTVKPLSQRSFEQIRSAIENTECVQSYKDHLFKEINKYKINENI